MQWNLSRKDILNEGHLSNEDSVGSLYHAQRWYKFTSELGTPLYTGQLAWPNNATRERFHCTDNKWFL